MKTKKYIFCLARACGRRPGYEVCGGLEQFGPRFKWLDVDGKHGMVEGSGSSSTVRARLRDTRDLHSAAGLVSAGVLGFIARQRLYLDD